MFQKILIATDFSTPAQAAVARGIWLAELSQGRAVLVHVLANLRHAFLALPYAAKSEFFYGDIEKFDEALRVDSHRKLNEVIKTLTSQFANLHTEVLLGKPELAISRAVLEERFDTVVIGTRGLTGAKGLLLGSAAQRVVRICPATVLVSKAEGTWPPRRIVVGIDFSDVSRRALMFAGWIAEKTAATLEVLHVVEDENLLTRLNRGTTASVQFSDLGRQIESESLERLQLWCQDVCPARLREVRVEWGTPWKVVADRADKGLCDLAVMGTVGRSGITGALMGNTAESALTHCDCSLLTVKSPEFQSPVLPAFWSLHPKDEPRPIDCPTDHSPSPGTINV